MSQDASQFIVSSSAKLSNSELSALEIYHLAHDLRGPLNSILGFTELLRDGIEGPLNEYQTEDIQAIHQSARNLLHMINHLVDLNKLAANRLPLNIEAVDLQAVCHNVLQYEFGTNKPAQIVFQSEIPPTLPLVLAEADRLEQMLLDMLLFAFSLKTRQVSFQITVEEAAVIVLVSAADAELSAKELETLFQLSVMVDGTGRSKLSRGGLTLPLVYQLAEAFSGAAWATSNNVQGTQLFLKLSRV